MLVLFVLAAVLGYYLYHEFIGKRRGLPPGPTPFPLIGNALQLDQAVPHKTIFEWSKKYGPVFTCWMGTDPSVVLCDNEAIKKYMFGKSGDTLTGRPSNFLFEEMMGGRIGVIFTDGDLWREQRRFTLHVLRDFGVGKTILEEGVNDEIVKLIASFQSKLDADKRAILSPKEWESLLELSITSVVAKIVIGHSFKGSDEDYQTIFRALKENESAFSNPAVMLLQTLPWLRFIPGFTKLGFDAVVENIRKFQRVVQKELELHKKVFKPEDDPHDFTMAYLREIHRRQQAGEDMSGFNEEQLGAIMFDLWGAGTNTTVITLRFAFFYILHHPDVQVKIAEELGNFYGSSDRAVCMADRVALPYTAATVQEIQRCANIVPINLPHSPMEDMDIAGYTIKKGVTVLPQMACVHIDPKVFPAPDEFRPERFLETGPDGQLTLKKIEELMPFSMGKRVCAGEGLARMELFMFFASVMRNFHIAPAPGTELPPLRQKGLIRCVFPAEYSFEIRPR